MKRESETVPKQARISRVMKPEQAERAHVLVVEDDEGVRGLIATTLALSSVRSSPGCTPSSLASSNLNHRCVRLKRGTPGG